MLAKPSFKISFMLLFFSFFACVKNEWVIDDYQTDPFPGSQKCIVYFNPRLESNYTRSLSLFPSGCKAQIFAFIDGAGEQSISSPVYESLKAGTLTPTQSPMVVPVGTYDFYAVSLKNDTLPPSFKQNKATGLQNGIDYLWSNVTGMNINTSGSVVDLSFNHCATQFVFNIVSTQTATPISSIVFADMTVPPPSPNASWDLLTGRISQTDTIPSDVGYLSLNGLSMSLICLPYKSSKNTLLAASVLNADDSLIFFNVEIPILPGGYQGGCSYQYEILFTGDTVLLGKILVAPWTEDQEGNIDVPD